MSEIFLDYTIQIQKFFQKLYSKTINKEKSSSKRYAWLTLICTDDYLDGILALSRSLKRSKTIYPLYVLIVEENVSKEIEQKIIDEGCLIKHIQGLYPNQDSQKDLAFQRLQYAWTKLRVFQLTDIADRCVFLDSDMIVLQNIDELFHLNDNDYEFAAVQTCICNPAKSTNYPESWKPSNCPYTLNNKHPNTDEDTCIFNSGLFLFEPNQQIFEEMVKCLNTWDLTQFKFADQDFLNQFYKNKWKCLPSIYNSLKTFSVTHPNIWDLSKIKIIHYILAKPWQRTDERNQPYEHINQLWWNAFQNKAN